MSTSKSYIAFIQDCLCDIPNIRVKAMFGEYALYKDGWVIGLICDDTFFLKITKSTQEILWENHPTWEPYKWAKVQFILEDDILEDREKMEVLLKKCREEIQVKSKKQKLVF